MTTFVLVHGAWHGAWCWDKVVPLLEKEGHRVVVPDLPGHGADTTPTLEVTLARYVERVCAVLDEQPEPVVLVGHSMAGVVVTQTAEERPDKVGKLVYLTAYLPDNGQGIMSMRSKNSLVAQNQIMGDDGRTMLVREEALREIFYNDCSDEDVARSISLLVPQAVAPLTATVTTSPGKFGRVPRVYIECLRDNAIFPDLQKQMYTAMPCERVITMDTSHSPFLSAPEALAGHLLSV